eukprot:7448534-Alexandrium_andersonii.AAC.1
MDARSTSDSTFGAQFRLRPGPLEEAAAAEAVAAEAANAKPVKKEAEDGRRACSPCRPSAARAGRCDGGAQERGSGPGSGGCEGAARCGRAAGRSTAGLRVRPRGRRAGDGLRGLLCLPDRAVP